MQFLVKRNIGIINCNSEPTMGVWEIGDVGFSAGV
jgi:hypothetical protein